MTRPLTHPAWYLVATPYLAARMRAHTASPDRAPTWFIDPMRVESAGFLDLIERLDTLAFPDPSLRLPRRAFYDCAEIPGCVFGLAHPANAVPEHVARALDIPMHDRDDTSPVPESLCIALPALEPGHFLVHTIACLPQAVPGHTDVRVDRMAETLASLVELLGATRVTGTTQWRSSDELAAHARFAPLRVRAAWLPVHEMPATLVFERAVTPDPHPGRAPEHTLVRERELDVHDDRALQQVQQAIEAGQQVFVIAVRKRADGTAVPILGTGVASGVSSVGDAGVETKAGT